MFLEELKQRIRQLKQIISEKEKALIGVPDGTIHIFHSDSRTQYYLNNSGKRKYIKESEKETVEKLCQKDYDQKVLLAAQKELKQLEKLYHNYSEKTCEAIYEKLNEERKKLVRPIWLPDKDFVSKWEQVEYDKKGFQEGAPEFYTDKGERVRSKTEILIANALYKNGVPYRYEAPLRLNYYGVVHPDFTILNIRCRREVYWEHMGMLDDENYRSYALERITVYEKNGIFPGDSLILTHETLKNPINSRMIEKMILQYLK